MLLGNAMRVRGHIMQFGGTLVVFVMRSVVVASGHFQRLSKTYDLA